MRKLQHLLFIEKPIVQVFEFFSKAENLEKVTPPSLQFKILSSSPINMELGTIINYRIRLLGIPMRWRTEITRWDPPYLFQDTQVLGPYRKWVHTHIFEEKDGGTLMTDIVEYLSPGWILEPLVHKLFVQRQLNSIFTYRETKFFEIFSMI